MSSPLTILQMKQTNDSPSNFPLRNAVPSIRYRVFPEEKFIGTAGVWSSDVLLCGTSEGDVLMYDCPSVPLQSEDGKFPAVSVNPKTGPPKLLEVFSWQSNSRLSGASSHSNLSKSSNTLSNSTSGGISRSSRSGYNKKISSITINPTNSDVFVAGQGKYINIYDKSLYNYPVESEKRKGHINCISFRPLSSSEVAVAESNGTVSLMDLRMRNTLKNQTKDINGEDNAEEVDELLDIEGVSRSRSYLFTHPWTMRSLEEKRERKRKRREK